MTQISSETLDLAALKKRLGENPGVILESLAEQNRLSMSQVIECLPESMWKRLDGSRFVEILGDMTSWGDVTLIMHTPDVILEFGGPIPAGKLGHGFYNLSGKSALHGHLRANNCGRIYCIERPFMGKTTASIQFMNKEGNTMFKVFLGRDDKGEIRTNQLEALRGFAKQVEAEAR